MNPNPPNQFQKGNTIGRRGGRPKKEQGITEWLRYRLRQPVSEEDRRVAIEAFADTAVKHALAGDVAWAKLALDRVYGKPAESLQLSGPDGAPLHVALEWAGHGDRD